MDRLDNWIFGNLQGLANISLNSEGCRVFNNARIELVSYEEIQATRLRNTVLIPVDITHRVQIETSWKAKFGGTVVHLYNQIPKPKGWRAVPDDESPVWWCSPTGSLCPSWNMWGVIKDLMLFREEQSISVRDKHGRFPMQASPRYEHNLIHVPIINNTLALLVDSALFMEDNKRKLLSGIKSYVAPPAVVLSHDCDNLTGNTAWTQMARVFRLLKLLSKARREAISQFGFIISNMLNPERWYFDDQIKMWKLQQERGFTSVAYILNGDGGRLGARTPFRISERLIKSAPKDVEVGVHYNYGYIKESEKLVEQFKEINRVAFTAVSSGRAHYLCFDPLVDFPTLVKHGVNTDESIGWPYRNSYRAGIAGPFRPFNSVINEPYDILELPMTFMDADLWREDGHPDTFMSMLRHIEKVGGCITILVHPGASENPERPEMSGVYRNILNELVDVKARSFTPASLRQLWVDGPSRSSIERSAN